LSFVRLHLEYACPVWHPGISREESDKIESIQKRAFANNFQRRQGALLSAPKKKLVWKPLSEGGRRCASVFQKMQ